MHFAAQYDSLTPQYDSELGTDPPRRGIQRGRQTVLTEILAAGEYLRAQPVRRGLSQPAKLSRESLCRSDWLRLRGILGTECMILTIRELAAFLRCSASAQLTAGERSSAQSPCRCQARSSALVLGAQAGQTALLWPHRQYLRLGARPLEVGSGCGWRPLPSCPQTGTSGSGTIWPRLLLRELISGTEKHSN